MPSNHKRLFIALWPSPEIQSALHRLTDGVDGGQAVAISNVHLTLAFIGASSPRQEMCYRSVLSSFVFQPFFFSIDRFGFWKEPRVLWAGMRQMPDGLLELVARLQEDLRGCGFTPESRPFSPHITLKRKYPGPTPDWGKRSAVHWIANTLALVHSQSTPHGVRYVPLLQVAAQGVSADMMGSNQQVAVLPSNR